MKINLMILILMILVFNGCIKEKKQITQQISKSTDINDSNDSFSNNIPKNIPPSTPPNKLVTNECVPSTVGVDYPIGPNQKYKNISDIDWDNLKAGDTVRIFYRPNPYREKIVIRSSGTKEHPLIICGVAGENGEKPILDGDNAINDVDDALAYGSYDPMQGLAMIMIYNNDYTTKDSNIIIDGLHIKNAKKGFFYKRVDGSIASYEDGAACIRIQAGDNIIIRNNELENCGNGIFSMSQGYNEAHLTRDILIENNYLHGHGQVGSYLEHALYIQAIGATYQFNRFGSNVVGSKGVLLKERVAGSVIRYNWFEGYSARFVDLVEVEDAASWYIESEYHKWAQENGVSIDPNRLKKVQEAEKLYRKSYIYGNFFNHVGSKTEAGSLIHYGWDNDPMLSREGTLYFYNNTVLIQNDRDDSWRFRIFDMRKSWDGDNSKESIEVFNNIIYTTSETLNKDSSYICMSNSSGIVNFGTNWINAPFNTEESLNGCYSSLNDRPIINGIENIIKSNDVPIDLITLLPKDVPSIKDKATALPKYLQNYPVTYQYMAHLNYQKRLNTNDLGAFEK